MKKSYKMALVASVGILSLGLASNAFAFHDGGVAYCEGCHTMHNSVNGNANAVNGGGSVGVGVSAFLTKGSTPSSTCLNCHKATPGSYHVMTDTGANTNAGGDFYWLTKDTPALTSWGAPVPGYRKGHNVIAPEFGIAADGNLTNAPHRTGSGYDASILGCNSCHDPHGKKYGLSNDGKAIVGSSVKYATATADYSTGTVLGNFRILGSAGYDGGALATGVSFGADAPIAVGVNGSDSNTVHPDYGSGMSEWCANCHGGFTDASANVGTGGSSGHRHPAGAGATLGSTIAGQYNAYVSTGDTAGTHAYDPMVPFERGVAGGGNGGDPNFPASTGGTGSTTLDIANTAGATGSSNVMCLSCHRAHATPFDNMGRWDFEEDILTEEGATEAAALGLSGVDDLYPQTTHDGGFTALYGADQRSLCNKCHNQDN